jgi:hypothetical protein
MPGIEPGALGLSPKTLRPPLAEDNRSTSAHRNGQGDGIRTRTVRVTGGDANFYITTLKMEPLIGLAPTTTSLRNSPCCCLGTGALKLALSHGFAP